MKDPSGAGCGMRGNGGFGFPAGGCGAICVKGILHCRVFANEGIGMVRSG